MKYSGSLSYIETKRKLAMENTVPQDEKDAIREEMLQDELHEHNLLTDWDYFLEHSNFSELSAIYTVGGVNSEDAEAIYSKLQVKAIVYGWNKDIKNLLK